MDSEHLAITHVEDLEALDNEPETPENRYRVVVSFNLTADTIDDVQELVRELLPGITLEIEDVEPAEVD